MVAAPTTVREPALTVDPRGAVVDAARRFWEALIRGDARSLDALVDFPFTWDAKCRLLATRAEMDASIAKWGITPNVRLGQAREVTRDQLGDRETRSFDKLAAEGGCEDDLAASTMQAEAARLDRRYVLVDLLVDNDSVPTVTRVGRRHGAPTTAWRVTGLDN
jgi:hypothetical protein